MNGKPNGTPVLHPLVAALRSGRERWVELEPGKRLKIRRPAEAEFSDFIVAREGSGRTMVVDLRHVQRYAVDWAGITEADLLGPTVGSGDEMPFNADVWGEAVADRLPWLRAAAEGLLNTITEHLQAQEAAAGNSPATSTPGPAAEVATVQTPAPTTTTH